MFVIIINFFDKNARNIMMLIIFQNVNEFCFVVELTYVNLVCKPVLNIIKCVKLIKLIDFKIEFGKLPDGTIILADEISPDTCRLWDVNTNEKLDKDRFRRDMGGTEEAYQEVMRRIFGE